MSSLPSIHSATGGATDNVGRRQTQANVLPADDGRTRKADTADADSATKVVAAAGVHASFSPQSLRALEDSAVEIAGDVKELVLDVGELGANIVSTAAESIDAVGEGAIELVSAGADSLIKGIDAVRNGVSEVADAAAHAVTDAAGRAGEVVESAAGYAALTALAGRALINVIV